jgi:hypothetical protein
MLPCAQVEAFMEEVTERSTAHECFHDGLPSILSGCVQSNPYLEDIQFPSKNLSRSLISLDDLDHVAVLGRIHIGRNSAKVKGDRVGLVKLVLLGIINERREKDLVLLGRFVLDLTNFHGGSFTKGLLVTFCGLISKCTTLKAGEL